MKRREFIASSFMGAVALSCAGTKLSSSKNNILSMQLYSVRRAMQHNPLDTLQKLSAIGYNDCEHAGYNESKRTYYNYSPTEFKQILADNGMTMMSGHTVFGKKHWNFNKKEVTDLWKTIVEDAAIAGQKYVISPWLDISLRRNFDDLKSFMDAFNAAGEYALSQGVHFGYHNHDFEFSLKLTSKRVYDIIMENTDPKLVKQQLDIGNMYDGGGRAMELLKQYPGRFELMHVKDVVPNGKGKHESTVLGKGVVGVEEVLAFAKKTGGTNYFIIEQESYQGQDPVAAMKDNYAIMQGWGF